MRTKLTLAELSRSAPSEGASLSAAGPMVPQPARRWRTRIALPLTLMAAAASLLGYSARQALLPATSVRVASVVTREVAGSSRAARIAENDANAAPIMTVQAPGWIEPDPFAVSVSALADGVIRDMLVLEGQRIEAAQVVARMIDDDAKIALQASAAALAVKQAERDAAEARVQVAEAELAAEQAMADEIRDEVDRKKPLAADQTIPTGDYRRLVLRLAAQEARTQAARGTVGEMRSLVAQAMAEVHMAEANLSAAKLTLERTEIRAPVAGVVLARLAEPGSRMMSSGQDPAGAVAVRLYDPTRLQVRVDIPLADAAKVGVGHKAQISTEALPDVTFKGRVTRLVQEANIQKNTVQVKVAVVDPVAALRPEMLARVRFFRPTGRESDGVSTVTGDSDSMRIYAPEIALRNITGTRATAWVVDEARHVASPREITLSEHRLDGYREVLTGLTPGDRVIVDPPDDLTPHTRIQFDEEASANAVIPGGYR